MEQAVYTIRTITNLHMGDIGSAVNIIDKSVQKDAVTEYPTIYATSLKGALRNAAAPYNAAQSEEKINLKTVFGDTNADGAWKGKYRFNDAHLLFYPIRSDHRPYYLAVSPMLLEQALQIMEIAGKMEKAIEIIEAFKEQRETDKLYVSDETGDVLVGNIFVGVNGNDEDVKAAKALLGLFNIENEPGLLYLSDQEMSEHLEQLPVIARNQLNNGISANLWYEEFVPRKTVFLTLISRECEEDTGFDKMLKEPFQMGANATVGYGLSVMQKVKAGGNQA